MQDPAARAKQRFLPTDPEEMRRTQTQGRRLSLIPLLQAVILSPSQQSLLQQILTLLSFHFVIGKRGCTSFNAGKAKPQLEPNQPFFERYYFLMLIIRRASLRNNRAHDTALMTGHKLPQSDWAWRSLRVISHRSNAYPDKTAVL